MYHFWHRLSDKNGRTVLRYTKEPLSKPVFWSLANGSEPALHHRRAVKACFASISPGTLRLQEDQPLAVLVEVHQREGGAQVIVVLLQAPEPDLHKSKDSLQDAKRMLHLSSHPGLGPILPSL
jgi:hypothetical protein